MEQLNLILDKIDDLKENQKTEFEKMNKKIDQLAVEQSGLKEKLIVLNSLQMIQLVSLR